MVQVLEKLHSQDLFPARYNFSFQMGHYLIKTAATQAEVLASLRLRHDVFYNELIGQSHPTGLDLDRYDTFFDHLIIIDSKNQEVIATYRLYSSRWGDDFYTKSEFDLTDLDHLQGPYLEMGRACVHRQYRRGVVMTLLWRGIAEYLKISGARVLMGCGSIKTEDVQKAALLTAYFQKNKYLPQASYCEPLSRFNFPDFQEHFEKIRAEEWTEEKQQQCEELIPPLFKSYLKAGAIVAGPPAWDRDFHCIDFVVLLEKEKISSLYGKKYGVSPAGENLS